MGKPSIERPSDDDDGARGFDASDPAKVTERNLKVKSREDDRAEGLRFVLSSKQGRTWMRHLIKDKLFTRVGKQRPAAIFTGNSTTFYNAALKELGDIISCEAATLAPNDFRLMENEGELHG